MVPVHISEKMLAWKNYNFLTIPVNFSAPSVYKSTSKDNRVIASTLAYCILSSRTKPVLTSVLYLITLVNTMKKKHSESSNWKKRKIIVYFLHGLPHCDRIVDLLWDMPGCVLYPALLLLAIPLLKSGIVYYYFFISACV